MELGLVLVLIYLSRYLDQETSKLPFRFSGQAATCYYQSNQSKVEAIPLSALPKDTTRFRELLNSEKHFSNKRLDLHLSRSHESFFLAKP